jgi:hypothetical protein
MVNKDIMLQEIIIIMRKIWQNVEKNNRKLIIFLVKAIKYQESIPNGLKNGSVN